MSEFVVTPDVDALSSCTLYSRDGVGELADGLAHYSRTECDVFEYRELYAWPLFRVNGVWARNEAREFSSLTGFDLLPVFADGESLADGVMYQPVPVLPGDLAAFERAEARWLEALGLSASDVTHGRVVTWEDGISGFWDVPSVLVDGAVFCEFDTVFDGGL